MPPPAFQRFLALDRVGDVVIFLVPDEPDSAILRGEGLLVDALLVVVHPLQQVGGDADIDRAAFLARRHVDITAHRSSFTEWVLG